jgi:hypothetical protein
MRNVRYRIGLTFLVLFLSRKKEHKKNLKKKIARLAGRAGFLDGSILNKDESFLCLPAMTL